MLLDEHIRIYKIAWITYFCVHLAKKLSLFCFVSDSSIIPNGKCGLEETRRPAVARSAVLNQCLEKIRLLE